MSFRISFVIVFLLLVGTGVYMHSHEDLDVPLAQPFGNFPITYAGWRMADQSMLSDDVIRVLRPTEYLSRTYINDKGEGVSLYLSFFNGSPEFGRIHSPKNCLPGGGWAEVSSQKVVIKVGEEDVNVVRAIYSHGDINEVIYYWFSMQGKTITNEYELKIAELTGSVLHRRRDQNFIRISVQANKDERFETECHLLESFVSDFYPVIKSFMPL